MYFQRADGDLALQAEGGGRVHALLAEEDSWEVSDIDYYRHFVEKVDRLRGKLSGLLGELHDQRHKIAVYGASAKSVTPLNYFGFGAGLIDFVVDRSDVNQGRYTPGMHLPIFDPERLLQEMPAYGLLHTWNFMEEIFSQQSAYRSQDGKFIIPIPELKVI